MIAIVNVGPFDDPDPGVERTYEVRINADVICKFKHNRRDGLGRCLLKAAAAVENKKYEDFEQQIKEIGKPHGTETGK